MVLGADRFTLVPDNANLSPTAAWRLGFGRARDRRGVGSIRGCVNMIAITIRDCRAMPSIRATSSEKNDTHFSFHLVMPGFDSSISCHHTVALHFRYDGCVSRSSGRARQHAHFFARGIRSAESKGFNTVTQPARRPPRWHENKAPDRSNRENIFSIFAAEKQARTTEATEQKRIWALRAVSGRAPMASLFLSPWTP
jgi:hypothetical protein